MRERAGGLVYTDGEKSNSITDTLEETFQSHTNRLIQSFLSKITQNSGKTTNHEIAENELSVIIINLNTNEAPSCATITNFQLKRVRCEYSKYLSNRYYY